MHHFFVEKEQIEGKLIKIEGSDFNHIKNVLRMKSGEEFQVSDGAGSSYLCELLDITQDYGEAEILSIMECSSELPSRIYLFQGLPKSDKMELIIQKAVELGVYEIIPVAAKRSIVKLDSKKEGARLKRWSGISESAAKQSKRGRIPEILPVMTFMEAVAYGEKLNIRLLPYENAEGMKETRRLISGVEPGMDIGVFIGPEGGFEETEVDHAIEHGWNPVTLGKRILRTETAGLTMLSILMYQLEEGE